MKRFLIFISIATAFGLIASISVIFIGAYIAIWGDNVFGGKIVASAIVSVVLTSCIGLSVHSYIKNNGGY